MIPGDVNLVAVVAAMLLSIVIGMLWYSPALFMNTWMKEMGMKKKDIEKAKKKGMAKTYVLMALSAFVTAYVLAHFVQIMAASTFVAGMQTGFWIWLGFVATVLLGSVLWEMKSIKYYAINASYQLVSLALAGGLLAVWP